MSDERTSDPGYGDDAPEILALRAEVARVRDTVIPTMRAKQEAISASLGGRRRRRSNPYAAIMQMSTPGPATRSK